MKKKKIYEGEQAIKDFLSPKNFGYTPVVELPSTLNPFKKDKVRIFIKLVNSLPLGNIKSLPSFVMLSNLKDSELKKIDNIIEYSSGNTALSLTIFAKHFGISKTNAIITPDVPEYKKRILRLVGTNLLISHGPSCPDVFADLGGVYEAKNFGKKAGWYNFNQYINKGNTESSAFYIGKEIWEQFGNKISVFVSSIGTAGTIAGAGSYLKNKNSKIKVIGAATKKGSSIPGPRNETMIHRLGIKWEDTVDEVVAVKTRPAFENSLNLIRYGLFVGPSTGMQLSALLEKIKEYKKKNKLNDLRNKEGEIICCFIGCDSMNPYIDDYFSVLPKSFFPKVKDL